MDTQQYGTEEKVRSDSERGPRIDIIAAGDDISSATSQVSLYGSKELYPGSSTHYMAKIGGTSMAAPQITGMGALWLQANPGGTAQQFKDFLKNHSLKGQIYDSGTAESFSYGNSYPRLYGAPNRMAYWPYNSPNPLKFRGTSGNDQ
jgi:subtilisin family serine protease